MLCISCTSISPYIQYFNVSWATSTIIVLENCFASRKKAIRIITRSNGTHILRLTDLVIVARCPWPRCSSRKIDLCLGLRLESQSWFWPWSWDKIIGLEVKVLHLLFHLKTSNWNDCCSNEICNTYILSRVNFKYFYIIVFYWSFVLLFKLLNNNIEMLAYFQLMEL